MPMTTAPVHVDPVTGNIQDCKELKGHQVVRIEMSQDNE